MSNALTLHLSPTILDASARSLTTRRPIEPTVADEHAAWGASVRVGLLQPTLVGPAMRERHFHDAIRKVAGFVALPKGFDGYGGLPASDRAARYSISLLRALIGRPEIPAPCVAPISTGTYIDWKRGNARLYFEVQDDSVLWVHRIGNGVVESDEDDTFNVSRAEEQVERFHHSG